MLDTNNTIEVQGARVHNLKNIDIAIPREKLVVKQGFRVRGNRLWHSTLFMPKDNAAM